MVKAAAVDLAGNIVVAGRTTGALQGQNQGNFDAFVRVLSSTGDLLWTRQFGTDNYDSANAMTVDEGGTIIVAGGTSSALQGESQGSSDAFVRVFSSAGDLLWTRQFGTSSGDVAHSVALDSQGNIIVAGQTTGPLQGEHQGATDAFVRVLSSTGDLLWTRQFGTSGYDEAYSVAADGSGNVIVAGQTDGALQGESQGDFDAFVARLGPP